MKLFKIVLAVLLFTQINTAQTIEITPMFGYTFNGATDAFLGKLDVKDDISYGGQLSIELRSGKLLQLSYQRNDANMYFKPYATGTPADRYKIGIEHYQLGFVRDFKQGATVPFGFVSLGTSRYFDKSDIFDERWTFTGTLGGGIKKYISEFVGIKLQANLILPMELNGGGFFCGPYGCGSNASFYIPIVHFELAAGIVFQLPQ